MKKNIILLIIMAIVLSGCASPKKDIDYENITTETDTTINNVTMENTEEVTYYNGTTSYEDALVRQSYRVGTKAVIDNEDDSKIIFTLSGISEEDPEYDNGVFVFVNGIPQQCMDEDGNINYISVETMNSATDLVSTYICQFNNVNKADAYICRIMRMLMPNTLITDQRNFNFGYFQSLRPNLTEKIVCEPGNNVDIGVLEGKKITYEESISNTDMLIADAINGDFSAPTVLERGSIVEGEYMIELTPQIEGEYVISFWGNGEPIQLGEHMFYQVNVEQDYKYQYTFNLTEDMVNSVDNFYTIVCPVSDIGEAGKTYSKIFVDEYRK